MLNLNNPRSLIGNRKLEIGNSKIGNYNFRIHCMRFVAAWGATMQHLNQKSEIDMSQWCSATYRHMIKISNESINTFLSFSPFGMSINSSLRNKRGGFLLERKYVMLCCRNFNDHLVLKHSNIKEEKRIFIHYS